MHGMRYSTRTFASHVHGVRALLRLEGAAVFAAALTAYLHTGGAGWAFAALLLAPDLSMVGYAANPRLGALAYNTAHTYLMPGAIGLIGLLLGAPLLVHLALIGIAHIGMDRAFGYGLKYATRFDDSHLARL